MKYIIISIFLLFLSFLTFSTGFPAEDAVEDEDTEPMSIKYKFEERYFGRGLIDGVVWKQFTQREKTFYLFGFEDGVTGIALHFIPDDDQRNKVYSTLPASVENPPALSEIIESIDEFYSDDENKAIPIYYVLLIIRNRLIGVDEGKIKRYIEYLRDSEGKDLEESIEGKENIKPTSEE